MADRAVRGQTGCIFASDYAHWDSDAPDMALPTRLPDGMKRKIYYENGRALYRLPDVLPGVTDTMIG